LQAYEEMHPALKASLRKSKACNGQNQPGVQTS
jgi:hypothetical protein